MKLSEFIKKYGDYDVTDELMKVIEKPDGVWTPKYGEIYWFVALDKEIRYRTNYNETLDFFQLEKRNVYKTKEEAEKALEMYEFCKARSFEPDWEDENEYKYYLWLNCSRKEGKWSTNYFAQDFVPLYYPNEEVVQEIIDKYSFEELEKYYGRV